MAKLKFCKNCSKVVEFEVSTMIGCGAKIIVSKCSNCGAKEITNVNNTHYGEDSRNK